MNYQNRNLSRRNQELNATVGTHSNKFKFVLHFALTDLPMFTLPQGKKNIRFY